MSSRYSIIQYVPNPIADERINIGIVAFNDRLVKAQFIKSWKRIRCFANDEQDIDYLQEFKTKVEQLASIGLLFSEDLTDKENNLTRLNKISQSWGNSIQLTTPRGSLEDPETLLAQIAKDLLVEPSAVKISSSRDRQAAVKVVRSKVRKVLDEFGKEAKEYYKKDHPLRGKLGENKFDVAVANGKVFFAAQSISFEVQTSEQTIASTSWIVSDVKQIQPNTSLGVVILPPKQESPHFERMQKVYQNAKKKFVFLGAEIVEEKDVESWAYDRLGKDFEALVS